MLPIGETIQLCATFRFNTFELYEKEMKRIAQIQYEKEIVYDTEIFYFPAYITLLSHNGCSEYMLLDDESLTMSYVYIQFVNADELLISDNLLPKILNSTNAHFDGDITEVEICIYYD